MGAYIINIPDSVDRVVYINVNPMNGKTYTASYSVENLTPYAEPDLEQVRMEGYEQGLVDGNGVRKSEINTAYQRGLDDAWEAVKKLARMDTDTSESITGYFGLHNIMHNLTASEVIEEIRAYEQAQKEKEEQIQVGDEVATDAGNRASVLYENPDGTQVFVFKSDGTAAWWTKSALHRTGRNFFEIATVLKKMRGEQDG